MTIQVIDDFLTKSYHEELLNLMCSKQFDWYFNEDFIDYPNHSGVRRLDDFGFANMLWDENGMRDTLFAIFWKPALLKILDTINATRILRSNANMTVFSPLHEDHIREPHLDYYIPNISTVYYVNETDGDTFVYDKILYSEHEPIPKDYNLVKRVSPKPNRLLVFQGNALHSAQPPTKHMNRIVINSNFEV